MQRLTHINSKRLNWPFACFTAEASNPVAGTFTGNWRFRSPNDSGAADRPSVPEALPEFSTVPQRLPPGKVCLGDFPSKSLHNAHTKPKTTLSFPMNRPSHHRNPAESHQVPDKFCGSQPASAGSSTVRGGSALSSFFGGTHNSAWVPAPGCREPSLCPFDTGVLSTSRLRSLSRPWPSQAHTQAHLLVARCQGELA